MNISNKHPYWNTPASSSSGSTISSFLCSSLSYPSLVSHSPTNAFIRFA